MKIVYKKFYFRLDVFVFILVLSYLVLNVIFNGLFFSIVVFMRRGLLRFFLKRKGSLVWVEWKGFLNDCYIFLIVYFSILIIVIIDTIYKFSLGYRLVYDR